jgi:cytidylate kinase
MSIITISRGSYSKGKEVAEKLSQRLNYKCIGREILLDASNEFHVPELKLTQAIRNSPSVLDKITYRKERYLTYIQAALLEALQSDNVVYHGFAGHFFLTGVSHVMKIRIIADMEDRLKIVMDRDRISRLEALHLIKHLDDERKKWSKYLYGIDTSDASLYDAVFHIHKITVNDAVDLICDLIQSTRFKTTPQSQKVLADLAATAKVKVSLFNIKPDIQVAMQNGYLLVRTEGSLMREGVIVQEILEVLKNIPEVQDKKCRINIVPSNYELSCLG